MAYPSLGLTEVFHDIQYMDRLGELRRKMPNATFTDVKPGWATDADVLYEIKGTGIPGIIMVKFEDLRSAYREYAAAASNAVNDNHAPSILDTVGFDLAQVYLDEAAKLTDDSVLVEWVRWVPNEPIPLARYVARYGSAEGGGFREDNMQPYREWTSKGVLANLTDDEKKVTSVEFGFTKKDMISSYRARGMAVPKWLLTTPPRSPSTAKR